MRILSCHIAGFGKFRSQAFDFSKPVVAFKEENGWGKTTLADFIECMLFGMDNGRSRSVAENMRVKYEPFSGGAYGGALLLEHGGKRYRVERSFGKTPSGDTARVYDQNNMLCYDFGERCERLGETLLKVGRESFRKSAYIAQGEGGDFGLPEDMKGRLIALLSVSGGANGAQNALDSLEAADRALRAKRKPAKGKLDEIDERLAWLAREQDVCLQAKTRAESLRAEADKLAARLQTVKTRGEDLTEKMERASRQNEYAARAQTYREVRVRAEQAQAEKARLEAFFNGVAPQTVNIDGVQAAATEFYAVREELEKTREKLAELEAKRAERAGLEARLAAEKKSLEAHGLLLGEAQAQARKKHEKAPVKRSKKRTVAFVLAFAAFLFGATQIASTPVLGYPFFILGAVVLVWSLASALKGVGGSKRGRGVEKSALAGYEAAQAAVEALEKQRASYPADLDEACETLRAEAEAKRERMTALKVGIERFLGNFPFGEIYDYRTAVERLKENIALHAEYTRLSREGQDDLAKLKPQENAFGEIEDIAALKLRFAEWQAERESLERELTRLLSALEAEEKRAAEGDTYAAEEAALQEEKTRLEKRLTAIRGAKQLLIKARENTAARYLEPVERRCKEYLTFMGFAVGGEKLRFAADGLPVFDENGSMRAVDYYSVGLRELIGLCVRLALFEAVFRADAPPLVLDDPFVNLDDDKTARAKKLVLELAKRYQIVYFTCKSERML